MSQVPRSPEDTIAHNFKYYAPKTGQPATYERIRATAGAFAADLLLLCPDSRERWLAITKIEEAVFWANAAVARSE